MFLFYDIETSGLNKCFDQVVQFAAIKTDLDFNELERHNIFVRLNPDVVPSPGAFVTHQISLHDIQNYGISEIEAIKKIHTLLNTPGVISLGYNSLGFDDEFLRFSFYRNLLPPYTHQYANNCGRMDLYPMTVMYYLFKNEIINWPERENVISLKLEFLSAANALHSGFAHDALSDTEGVVELARRFAKGEEMWKFLCGFFNKKKDQERLMALPIGFEIDGQKYAEGILFDGAFGAKNFFQSLILNLGQHNHYKNQFIFLKLDSTQLTKLSSENISESFHLIYKKKFGECGFLLPFSDRHGYYLTKERLELIRENKEWIKQNPKLFKEFVNYYLEYKYPIIPNVDVDAMLYQMDFRSDRELIWCRKFHAVGLQDKLAMYTQLPESNLQKQVMRLLARNFTEEELPDAIMLEYTEYLKTIMAQNSESVPIDYKGKRHLTPQIALQEAIKLRQERNLDDKQNKLLDELELCLHHL